MATITPEPETTTGFRTLADVIDRIGVPAHRILARPTPGTATVEDVVALEARENRLAELVDGVLVEKAMGFLRVEPGLRPDSTPQELPGHESPRLRRLARVG